MSSAESRGRELEGLEQSLQKLTIKQQAKDLLNLTVLDILFSNLFSSIDSSLYVIVFNQKRWSPTAV